MAIKNLKLFYYGIRKWFVLTAAILGWPIFSLLMVNRGKNSNGLSNIRILVIPQLTRIGDLVCATPMFRIIKKYYPNSFLAVLATNRTKDIIKNNSAIDEIIIFKSVDFLKRVLPEIRSRKFDYSFNISATSLGSLTAFLGLIPRRFKLTRRPRPLSEFLTDSLNSRELRYKHHTYLPQYYLKMLEFIGIYDAEEMKQVFTAPSGEKKVEEFLKARGVRPEDLLVGISIAAQNRIKEWGDDKFKEVAKYLNEKYGAKIVFLGVKKDEERIDKVLSDLKSKDFFKTVDFTLEELPSLIKRLKLYIAVDTGPIYVAHALKVPLIDIIGPVDPNEQPPNDETSFQVRPPAHIKPSSFVMKKAGKPEEHKEALKTISIESVFSAVDKGFRIN